MSEQNIKMRRRTKGELKLSCQYKKRKSRFNNYIDQKTESWDSKTLLKFNVPANAV